MRNEQVHSGAAIYHDPSDRKMIAHARAYSVDLWHGKEKSDPKGKSLGANVARARREDRARIAPNIQATAIVGLSGIRAPADRRSRVGLLQDRVHRWTVGVLRAIPAFMQFGRNRLRRGGRCHTRCDTKVRRSIARNKAVFALRPLVPVLSPSTYWP